MLEIPGLRWLFAMRLGLNEEAVYHERMNLLKSMTTMICAIFLLKASISFGSLSSQEIVRKADEARYPGGQFSFSVKVTDTDGSSDSTETIYRVHTKDSNHSLVETKAPERLRGRKLLMKKNDLWMYLPTLKKPTRVGFEQRLTGEVSNGDLARANFATDYKAKLISEEKINNVLCYKLLLTAKTKEVAYRRIVYWVEKKGFYPVQANFYAISGKLLKTGKYSEIKPVLDKNRVTQLVITDALHGKHQSTLSYFNFKKAAYDETFFSKESLSD
jgi:Outer membrane lipoprotein-sorting protein